MRLHWHRRDLRAADNRGLVVGVDPVVPVFVFDEDVLSFAGPPRVAFMLDALASLRSWYRDGGSDLVVRQGDPREVLPTVAREFGAAEVSWCRNYAGLARERDAAVRRALDDADVSRRAVHDALLHEPGSIRTNDGDVYSVFSYFWRKWRDRPNADPVDPPAASDLAEVSDETPLPSLADLGFDEPEADLQPAGTDAARQRLRAFCDGPIYRYAEDRDYPAAGCTSRLSADLKFGTIGPRAVYDAVDAAGADAAMAEADAATSEDDASIPVDAEAARESVTEYRSQLAWREFYAHVLWDRPDTVTENYREYERDIAWRTDPDGLRAWKDGETGYPIVDAGMRQLRREAWMHNRVRMLVASFLTKDLMIDWREGYDWFREKLVDHDPANDAGGWQWAASTGTDAQPYFRVFNPTTQGERYDPDAEYVRRHVPELRDVPTDAIHRWHDLEPGRRERLAPNYPAPIVDHGDRRERAIETFETARGEG